MKIFIFGAGASLGSQDRTIGSLDPSFHAPLVDQLFNPTYKKYSNNTLNESEFEECKNAVKSCGSLERWLTERWEAIQALRDENSKQAEKAFFGGITFYLWFLLQAVSSNGYSEPNGYSILLQKIRKKDELFALISFNYDTLLDQAVQHRFRRSLLTLEEYLSFGLIKPHGSVNWLLRKRAEDPGLPEGTQIEQVLRLRTATSKLYNGPPHSMVNIEIINPDNPDLLTFEKTLSRFRYQYFYPLLFMPLTGKLYSQVEGFQEKIIQRGHDLLRQASEIYLVGYRAADDLIKEMFKNVNSNTVLHVIGIEQTK